MGISTQWESRDSIYVSGYDYVRGWFEETLRFPGARVERRQHLVYLVHKYIPNAPYELVADIPALYSPNPMRDDHDWVDRRQARGLLRLVPKCHYCGRRLGNAPNAYRRSLVSKEAYWAGWLPGDTEVREGRVPVHEHCINAAHERYDADQQALRELRLVGRQAKFLRKLADLMDTPMSFGEASDLLPWRPHKNALLRMVIRGRLNSTRVNGERRLRGRDLLPLVKSWVDTGRAPWRHNNKTRAQRQSDQCPTN